MTASDIGPPQEFIFERERPSFESHDPNSGAGGGVTDEIEDVVAVGHHGHLVAGDGVLHACSGECLGESFDRVLGTPADYDIYYVLAHYHEWGNYFRLSFVDEDGGDRTVFELQSAIGEPLGATLDPPVSSQGAPGLRAECGYVNNTDRRLEYGLGGQEMCVFLAYTDADLVIGATSGANAPKGQNDDGIYMNETSCGPVLAVPAP